MKNWGYDRYIDFGVRFICKEKDYLFMLNFQDKIMNWDYKFGHSFPLILNEKTKHQ